MKTGCSSGEALFAQRYPLCPERKADGICTVSKEICFLEVPSPYGLVHTCTTYQAYLDKIEGQEES